MEAIGVPTPKTIAAVSPKNRKILPLLVDNLQKKNDVPIIVKTRLGSLGNGVTILESRRSAISHLEATQKPSLVQKMIIPSNVDTRVFIVGGKIVASMQRRGGVKEFRANLSKKGVGHKYALSDYQAEIALKTAENSMLGVVGVDIMTDMFTQSDYVIEYNSNPGLGIEKVTGVNIIRLIAKFAIDLLR